MFTSGFLPLGVLCGVGRFRSAPTLIWGHLAGFSRAGNPAVAARSGRCPETRRGALCPLDPLPKAEPLGPFHLVGVREGRAGVGGVARIAPAFAGAIRAAPAQRQPAPPSPPTNWKGSKGRCPWRESRGQRPLVGSRGNAPGLASD